MQFGKIVDGDLKLRTGNEPLETNEATIFNPKPEHYLEAGWKYVYYDVYPADELEHEEILEETDDGIYIHYN